MIFGCDGSVVCVQLTKAFVTAVSLNIACFLLCNHLKISSVLLTWCKANLT